MNSKFHHRQDDMITHATKEQHKFWFSCDHINIHNKTVKIYNSSPSIKDFITLYQQSEEKHFYEIIHDHFYEYYDIDFKVDTLPDQIDTANLELFNWFENTRDDFIKHNITNINFLNKPDWIITTASSVNKLSLHLINRNCIFNENFTFKAFYSSFKAYINSFINHQFTKAIDFCVSSNYRNMRLCGSTKINSDRVLKVFSFYHQENIPLYQTFISSAIHDNNLSQKLITKDIFNELFMNETITKTSDNIHFSLSNNKETTLHNDIPQDTNTNQIYDLLNLLSIERSIDYNDWFNVCAALKYNNNNIQVFLDFSKKSTSNYNKQSCINLWNSIKPNHQKPITLGSIHYMAKLDNPLKYPLYIKKYTKIKIDFPFTPDITINQKYISDDIYTNIKNCDILALKSNMNTGKTFSMPSLFKDYKHIIVVYFRISLNQEIHTKWSKLGFELYSEIKGHPIDMRKHPRIIIQIDSLPRIQGHGLPELLILDEIESLQPHMMSSKYIDNKATIFNTLENFIKNTPKIILCDANLSDTTINNININKKNVIKINNEFKSFSHITANFYHNQLELINKIKSLLSNNKRIVIPSNSKTFLKNMTKIISKHSPHLKIGIIIQETKYIPVDKWQEYDLILYSPSILAGVSFDLKNHFHSVVAYFNNRTTDAFMSSQMLFRVRNLIDNNLFIYTPVDYKKQSYPISNTKIEHYINQKIILGSSSMNYLPNIIVDNYTSKVAKNNFYNMYKQTIKVKNMSIMYFDTFLKKILQEHGVNILEIISPLDNIEILKEISNDLVISKKEIKREDAIDIINSKTIDEIDYTLLIESKNERTIGENLSIKKYQIITTFNLPENVTFKPDSESHITYIQTNIRHIPSYKRYQSYIDMSILDSTDITTNLHVQYYEADLIKNYNIYSDSSDNDDKQDDSDPDSDENTLISVKIRKRILRKKNIKKTIIQSIDYNPIFLQINVCLNILHILGFTSIYKEERIKLQWEALHKWYYKKQAEIKVLFDDSMYVPEILTDKIKNAMSKSINTKLETIFGIKLVLKDKREGIYIIEKQFIDTFEYSLYKLAENLLLVNITH